MATQTKGFCKYCGKEYTKGGMLRHLAACKKRKDKFIRDIWVECCEHLSAYEINGISYERYPDEDYLWGTPARNMNYRLRDVVKVGDSMSYEYDFGSTTDLILNVHSYREGVRKEDGIVILSRNNPVEIICSQCGKNKAKWVNPESYYEGEPFWCEKCLEEDYADEDESYGTEYMLPICNSPRMGVCGYEGSMKYPDQFEPDKDKLQ